MTLITSLLEPFKRFPGEHHCRSILINLSEKSAFTGSFRKSISVGDCLAYLGFLSQTFDFLESTSLPLDTCVEKPHFGKTFICSEIKFKIVVKVFSVSCVSFKMFSVHYRKCILPTYPEWNIRQVWKFNILWASSNTKLSVLLNVRHREICLRYLLRSFPSVSL